MNSNGVQKPAAYCADGRIGTVRANSGILPVNDLRNAVMSPT